MLNSALYVPSYDQNISAQATVEGGASISLDKQIKDLRCPDGTTFEINQRGRIYYLNSILSSKNSTCTFE